MNKYEAALFDSLSYKYPGYLIGFDEYPEIIIIAIKNRSSRLIYKKAIQKPVDISFVENVIERTIEEMREEELKSIVGRYNNNFLTNSYLEIKPMAINKYSIAPKEIIFQDERTTIINWNDRTKTVVKCSEDDVFSPEAGVALCYMKKFITDNDSERFHRILKSLVSVSKFKNSKQEDKEARNMLPIDLSALYKDLQNIKKAFDRITMEEKYDIDTGTPVNSGDNDTDGSALEVE